MSEQSGKVGFFGRVGAWFSRWQEFVIWLPVLCVLAVVGYVVLGAITRVGADPLAWLAEVPVMCAWAAVAAGAAWLIKRTYLLDLDDAMERELYERVLNEADPEAKWLLVKDRLEWLVLLVLVFAFYVAGPLMRVWLLPLLLLLAACSAATTPVAPPAILAVEAAQDDAAVVVAPAVEAVESAIAEAAVPAIVAVQGAVQSVLPAPIAAPAALPLVSPAAAALIVRWEVSSPAHYTRRLDRPIWPQGASGITWGIGYDGGHATARDIRHAWRAHGEVERLASTAGIVGTRARDALPTYRDIVTPYGYAADVFAEVSLPVYHASTRRAFGEGFDVLPPDAAGALVSMVYNRGGSMAGDRNREKRAIRDVCIPAGDLACIGVQLRGMCRLWIGTVNERGLCDRRADEARLAESAA